MKKLIKRGFAALLALTLALGMSVSAFAVDATADTKAAVVKKEYQRTNTDTTSPAETFTFTAEAEKVTDATNEDGTPLKVTDMPALTIAPVVYEEGEAGSATSVKDLVVTTPVTAFPNVGVYTYKVTETASNTAGVTCSKQDLTLIATVYHEGFEKDMKVAYTFKVNDKKGDNIVNTYSAGSLQVGKTVVGALGNKSQKFKINVTFTAPEGKTVQSTINLSDGTKILPSAWTKDDTGSSTVTTQISLVDRETRTFSNVPYDVQYTVKEEPYEGYKATYSSNDGKENTVQAEGSISADNTVAHVTNTKNGDVVTGVILHSAPYILLLVGVGAAAVAFLILKKHREV